MQEYTSLKEIGQVYLMRTKREYLHTKINVVVSSPISPHPTTLAQIIPNQNDDTSLISSSFSPWKCLQFIGF
jgi:hypothetical protein